MENIEIPNNNYSIREEEEDRKVYKFKFMIGKTLIKIPIEDIKDLNINKFSYELSEKYKLPFTKMRSYVELQTKQILDHINKKTMHISVHNNLLNDNNEEKKELDQDNTIHEENKDFSTNNSVADHDVSHNINNNTNPIINLSTIKYKNKNKTKGKKSYNTRQNKFSSTSNKKSNNSMINSHNISKIKKTNNSSIMNINNLSQTNMNITHMSMKKSFIHTKTYIFHQEFEKIKNVGDKVYQKSLVELEKRRKNAEKIKQEMEEKELKECKVRPIKSEYSTFLNFKLHFNLIPSDRKRDRVGKSTNNIVNLNNNSKYNSNNRTYTNNFNKKNKSIAFNNSNYKDFEFTNEKGDFTNMEISRVDKNMSLEKSKHHNVNSGDLTFEEEKNTRLYSHDNLPTENTELSTTNIRFKGLTKKSAKEVNETSNRLFRDWETKIVKRQQLQEEFYRDNYSFHPEVNNSILLDSSIARLSPDNFYKRVIDWREKKQERLNNSIARASEMNLTTGEELFKPNSQRPKSTKSFAFKFNEDRFKKSIFERLFGDFDDLKEKKKENEEKLEAEVKNSTNFVIKDMKSRHIAVENQKEMINELYKVINPNEERFINLSNEHLEVVLPNGEERKMLMPLLKYFQNGEQGISHTEFLENCSIYLDKKMNYDDRRFLYEWYTKKKRVNSPKKVRREKIEAEIKKKFSFKPDVATSSLSVLEASKKYSNTTFQDRINNMIEKKKTFVSQKSMEIQNNVDKNCSFKPNTIKEELNVNRKKTGKSFRMSSIPDDDLIREKDSDKDSENQDH